MLLNTTPLVAARSKPLARAASRATRLSCAAVKV
jgi:hypothetical protein